MTYVDPIVVTVNAVAQSLARTSTGPNNSQYRKDDDAYRMTISHEYGKSTRRLIRLDNAKTAPDPLFPAQNAPFTASCHLVVTEPTVGYTNAELKLMIDGFLVYLQATSGTAITKLLAGES